MANWMATIWRCWVDLDRGGGDWLQVPSYARKVEGGSDRLTLSFPARAAALAACRGRLFEIKPNFQTNMMLEVSLRGTKGKAIVPNAYPGEFKVLRNEESIAFLKQQSAKQGVPVKLADSLDRASRQTIQIAPDGTVNASADLANSNLSIRTVVEFAEACFELPQTCQGVRVHVVGKDERGVLLYQQWKMQHVPQKQAIATQLVVEGLVLLESFLISFH